MISWLKRFNWGLNSDSGKRGKNKRRHVVARNRRRTILEQLEGRQLLAVVTVFSDNFETSTGATYDTSGAIGSSDVWNVSPTADFGARIHDGILDLTNTATAAANANGSVFGYFDNSTATAPWTSTLSSNPGTVSWEFNMRQIRTNPAGFGVGNYGAAFVLAGTDSKAATEGNGYAVVLGNSGTVDPMRLVSYTEGLQGTLADIITSNTTGLADFGNQYLSVRVEYTPSSNQWQMFLRNDGTSAFTDPTTGSALVSQGTAVDSTFTSTADKNFTGGYWQGSTAGNQTAFFDNFYLKVDDPGPSTTPAVVLSPNVSTVSVVEGGATASLNLSFTQLPTSNVTVTITPSNNEVDLGNGAGVARILTFTPTDATTAQSFLITAIDDTIVEGPHDSVLTFAIASDDASFNSLILSPVTVNITDNDFASLVAPYSNDFEANTGVAGLGEGWSVFSVDSDTGRTWNAGTFSGDRVAQANSFNGSAPADDWLISPPFDLDASSDEVVSFDTWTRFTDSGVTHPALSFLYSTDYSGIGDPTAATWTELTFTASASDSQVTTPSGDIDVSSIMGDQVFFAFRYRSSGNGSGTSTQWRVDDFSLASSSDPPVESSFVLLNEILFDPPGIDTPHEYVELRGEPGTVVPANTYLVNIEGDSSTGFSQGVGKISNMFNLSGLLFGANGLLVLAQGGNSYTFDPDSNSMVSSTGDFGGFDFFQSDVSANQIENATNSLLLVSSPIAPQLTDDVDDSNDGVLDGPLVAQWTLLDGVSVSDGDAGDQTYAPVVFTGSSIGYVARIGNSTGQTQADWVGAAISGSAPDFTLAVGGTTPAALEGLTLDHIGSTNPELPVPLSPGAAIPFDEDFATFTAAGFVPEPTAGSGQLDSNFWRVTGMSDGTGLFGGTYDSGDFARGSSAGGVSSGGVYAFDVGNDVVALGFQPTGSDFEPGTLTLKLTNTTGATISDWDISFVSYVLNNEPRSSSVTFQYSTNDVDYTEVPGLSFTTPADADETPAWVGNELEATLIGVSVADGESIFLQWANGDSTGGGARDEFGIANVSVSAFSDVSLVTPTITASPLTKVYDGSAFTVTATADDGDGGFDADIDQDNFTFTFYAAAGATGGVIAAPTNAGTYSVKVAYAGNSNYNPVGSTVFDFTITAKAATITADAQAKVYGDADPALTFDVDGLVGTDAATGSLVRAAGADVGSYGITQGTVSLGDNYSVTFVGADLTITARSLQVIADAQTKIFGEADPALTFSTNGLLDGDEITGGLTREAGEDAGVYAILLGDLTAGNNYTIEYTGASFTIAQGPVQAPQVASVVINGGDTYLNNDQRSQLTSVVVNFDRAVTLASGAFRIENANTGDAINASQLLITPNTASDSFTIRFAVGPGVVERLNAVSNGNSLEDGNYRLTIDSSKVSAGSDTMASDFVYGNESVDDFFRLFGDSDGDGDVDGTDLIALRRAFLGLEYNAAMDANGNGVTTNDRDDVNAYGVNRNKFRQGL